jgi:hypothetical protein
LKEKISEYGLTLLEKKNLAKFLSEHEKVCSNVRNKYSISYDRYIVNIRCKICGKKKGLSNEQHMVYERPSFGS